MGEHSAEAQSQGAYLLQPIPICFNKIKHCRRIATRYDKLAANYLAFVQLASIRLWLRVYEFTP
jgi:transposase